MDNQPHQPSKETGEPEPTHLSDRSTASDSRHLALINVLEFRTILAVDLIQYRVRHKAALLRSHWSLAGQLFSRLRIDERTLIARDKDIGMFRNRQILLHDHTACSVALDSAAAS